MLEYHAAYFQQDDGWYVAEMLDFPGVFSQGKTLRAARLMIRDALTLMAECVVEEGKPLPRPDAKAKAELAKKADFLETVPLKMRFSTAAIR